ncbi:MAG: peptidylprolyl isomerase [Burkholderiaceae bacterium]|nr:peptidylprolyl isomerase [Burkholderiaceae bacterium]
MTFKAVTPVLLCLACVGMLGESLAQGVRLAPSPAMGAPVPKASTPNSAATASSTAPIQADYIVAIVNSEPVTNNEVRTRLIRFERRLAEQRVAMPPRAELVRDVLEDVISEKIQLQLARESGLKVDDRAVDAAVQDFANLNKVTVAELRTRVSADGVGFAQIRADLQNQLLIQKVREREVLARITIADSDIALFLQEQFGAPGAAPLNIDLAQILIAVPENATESQIQALRARAERVLARARAGEDFLKLAQENSDAKDAGTGGQMGLRSVERYPTLFAEATQNLKEGGIAGPIRSGAGFHVLKVLTKQQDSNSNFSITQTKARHILLRTGPQLSEAAAKTKLADFKKRIESGAADFATLAKDNSQDGSAAEGGSLGWAGPGQYVPEFENAINQLAPGKISDPIVSRFGVHLILVEERRKSQLTLAERREFARNALREKKLDETYINWLRDLRSNAYVEYREPPQ